MKKSESFLQNISAPDIVFFSEEDAEILLTGLNILLGRVENLSEQFTAQATDIKRKIWEAVLFRKDIVIKQRSQGDKNE